MVEIKFAGFKFKSKYKFKFKSKYKFKFRHRCTQHPME